MYTHLIQDLYEGSSTSINSMCGVTEDLREGVGALQSSALSSYLFSVVKDK